jgi:adenine-specific DNA-methyltransferase
MSMGMKIQEVAESFLSRVSLRLSYYRLAPSLLEKDKWGQWVISKEFNAAMLAEASCKLEGFTYAPSDTLYWQHGHSTERDFIYVTTQH